MPKPTVHKSNIRITDKSVMLALEFSQFGNTKRIADVGDKGSNSTVETKAKATRITVTKKLLDSVEMKAIETHKGQIRNWLYTKSVSSMLGGGVYVIPHGVLETVDDFLIRRAEEREELVAAAVAAYDKQVKEAKKELGPAFNPQDYPTSEEFAASFDMHWKYMSFEVPKQLKEIKAEIFEREQEKARRSWGELTEKVGLLMRGEMAGLVSHMVKSLSPKPTGGRRKFNNTLIGDSEGDKSAGNITDFLETFEARNITGDKELAALVEKAKALLKGVDNDQLRDDETLREKVKEGMEKISQKLDTLVEDAPSRSYDL